VPTALVALGCAVLLGFVGTSQAVALTASESFEAHLAYIKPNPLTAAQAVSYLNAQREANGIPGGLVEEPRLSEGCEQYTNVYVPASGQYPHGEVSGQPGSTPLGGEAAASSDLSPNTAGWSGTINPWTGAPLHLSALFNPAVTTAWYGERRGAFTITKGENVCMGTDGARQFSGAYAYSLPGNGSTNVPFSETSGEGPYTPAEAVGLRQGTATGPTFILWPEGFAGSPSSVSLRSAAGATVAVRVATPQTPSPKTPPGFPEVRTIGEYSRGASFVVPVHPLAGGTAYSLSVVWQPPAGPLVPQVVNFTTAKRYVGTLSFKTTRGKVVVSASPAVGQAVTVQAEWGFTVCVLPQRPCPVAARHHEYNVMRRRVLRFTTPTVTMKLPRRPPGDDTFEVFATMHEFNVYGQRWESNTLTATSR
jgi:hypothetical protein